MKEYTNFENILTVNEAWCAYQSSANSQAYFGKTPLPKFHQIFQDPGLLVACIRSGVSYALFKSIQTWSPYSEEEWAVFLQLSPKTLQRSSASPGFRFKPIHSEKILQLSEVFLQGYAVFESQSIFKSWLKTVSIALGGATPEELMQVSYGKDIVLAEINNIDHGIFI
ncbi:MAG: putative toxin-antitoxin system antitoxin component (TIGR02293 family) [Luteibaculaceae bacterium]|jgi:putative toxin-antitoxin system antitoxin component (TIGR02293 family)